MDARRTAACLTTNWKKSSRKQINSSGAHRHNNHLCRVRSPAHAEDSIFSRANLYSLSAVCTKADHDARRRVVEIENLFVVGLREKIKRHES